MRGVTFIGLHLNLEYDGSRYLLTGTKMFITGATYGRLVKLLTISEGKPVVVLVKLPTQIRHSSCCRAMVFIHSSMLTTMHLPSSGFQ